MYSMRSQCVAYPVSDKALEQITSYMYPWSNYGIYNSLISRLTYDHALRLSAKAQVFERFYLSIFVMTYLLAVK